MVIRSSTGAILLACLIFSVPVGFGQDKVRMVPADGAGKYWPRWRGPSGQGLAADGPYLDKWSDTENVLWKIAVPGRGNSSPIVWAEQIFLTTAYDNGKKRSILCFDRATGKQLWETFAPEARPERAQGKNGYASGTPTTDGERVYAYFGNAGLLCLDMKGTQVWHASFGISDPYHGMACSPLLHKDRIIIFQEREKKEGGGFVIALDKKTGQEIWKTPRTETVSWGSPVAISVNGQDQIIVSSSMKVYSYSADDGKLIWTCDGNNFEVIPTPVVGHDLVYCCSGRVGPTLAIKPMGATGNITKSHLAWRVATGSPFVPSPLIVGDLLYMVNDISSVIACFDARTGKLHWKERCGKEVREGFSASPVAVNNKVFFTNDEGQTFVLANGPEFKLLHVNELKTRTLASPALVDGRWYWRTQTHLLCIGK